jgi:MoaA/NifB/PqqE/SkfB family radical SAM enzyme
MERVTAVVERNDNISVVGIAGPGDPRERGNIRDACDTQGISDLILCVSTNGLYLTRIESHEVRGEEPHGYDKRGYA